MNKQFSGKKNKNTLKDTKTQSYFKIGKFSPNRLKDI